MQVVCPLILIFQYFYVSPKNKRLSHRNFANVVCRAKGWIMGFEFCSLICVKKAARIRSQSKVVGWWRWRNDAAGFLSAGGAGAMMPATALPTQDQADVKMMATLAMPPLEQNKAADSFGQRTSNPLLSTASRDRYIRGSYVGKQLPA